MGRKLLPFVSVGIIIASSLRLDLVRRRKENMKTLIVLVMLLLPLSAFSETMPLFGTIEPSNSHFYTGNKYFKIIWDTSPIKVAEWGETQYISGLVDGVSVILASSPYLQHYNEWFNDCIRSMYASQIKAIVEKYMREHPEELHHSMGFIFYKAIHEICPHNQPSVNIPNVK